MDDIDQKCGQCLGDRPAVPLARPDLRSFSPISDQASARSGSGSQPLANRIFRRRWSGVRRLDQRVVNRRQEPARRPPTQAVRNPKHGQRRIVINRASGAGRQQCPSRQPSPRKRGEGALHRVRRIAGDGAAISPDHALTEFGELVIRLRRARMVRRDAPVLRRKAEGQRNIKTLQRPHLPIEPVLRMRPEAVGPAQSGTQIPHTQPLQPVTAISSR